MKVFIVYLQPGCDFPNNGRNPDILHFSGYRARRTNQDQAIFLYRYLVRGGRTSSPTPPPGPATQIENGIAATDRQIDRLVYQLYGLTDVEIAVGERAAAAERPGNGGSTGIFLGAYGHATALRRRRAPGQVDPLARLVDALCKRVPQLRRLRFSSLEPGDVTPDLIATFRSQAQVVPHFHLPLQSGSNAILHRMNRQYARDDYLRMIDDVRANFDRPALTTDIIVGFPGETDDEFARTLEVVDRAAFIHIHAFSFSPRPRTAAARWQRDFIRGPVVNARIEQLTARAQHHSFTYRRQFLRQTVEVLVERPAPSPGTPGEGWGEGLPESSLKHGRTPRYFDVHFDDPTAHAGDLRRVHITHVTPTDTFGRIATGG